MTNHNTPLHIAAQNGNAEIVKMLLDAGHDPTAPNAEGLTPLHLAVQMGHAEIAALLAEKSKPKSRPIAGRVVPPSTPQSAVNNPTATLDTPPGKAVTMGAWGALIFFVVFGVLSILGALFASEEDAYVESSPPKQNYTEPPRRWSPVPHPLDKGTSGYTNALHRDNDLLHQDYRSKSQKK